jgi:2-succinyl-5-enolpyruvyl-6-hydroxy-3-cyclohexene-1-carboxylate synthase
MLNRLPQALEPTNPLYAYTGAFVDEIRRAGIQHAVICPGSRSTPLALALAQHQGIRIWMHVDERSAGFFALGIAKRLRRPVAVLCTSGTAAANLYPAIIEARLSHIPLLVLTADRPPELRECGAPQSIDQNRLYGQHVKWYMEVSLPLATNDGLRYIRTLADRSVALTLAVPAGPVHLNFPFREPLTPEPAELLPVEKRDIAAWNGRADSAPYIRVSAAPQAAPPAADLAKVIAVLARTSHGLIIAGPQADPSLVESILDLASTLGYPVLADPLSQLRVPDRDSRHATVVSTYDTFLRPDSGVDTGGKESSYAPDVILRFGAMPVSKSLLLFLQRHAHCPHMVVSGDGGWDEPTQLAADMIHADSIAFCAAVISAAEFTRREESRSGPEALSEWESLWRRTELHTRGLLGEVVTNTTGIFEGRVFTELARLLPEQSTLVVGNSMPVRDCDTFFWGNDVRIEVFGNRGASGIDGVISTALGISAARESGEHVVLVLGDLSFYHDSNGLLAALLHHLDLSIILINNDGGGIFSLLPQANYPEHFEELFGTPTGLDFQSIVQTYGGHFIQAENWEDFGEALQSSRRTGGLWVVEVRTNRESNASTHCSLWNDVGQALRSRSRRAETASAETASKDRRQ